MSQRRRSPVLGVLPWLLLAVSLVSGTAWGQSATTPSRRSPEHTLAKTLARLDELLDLGTFPDSSPLWPARMAAALEARAEDQPGSDLVRGLAAELRRLPVDRPLGPPPQTLGGPPAPPPGVDAASGRADRVQRILEVARKLEQKLTAAARRSDAAQRGPAARFAGLAVSGNDDCAAAAAIGTGTFTGSTAGAGNDGNASCGTSDSSPDVWFLFTAPAAGTYDFNTFGSSFDTVLSLYDGCDDGNGRSMELACSDDAAGSSASQISRDMAAAEAVIVRLSGFAGASGAYTLTVALSRGFRGTVRRQDSGVPLAGVEVDVFDQYGDYETVAVTGGDGSYVTAQLAPGTYYARVEQSGFLGELYYDVLCPFSGYCDPLDGTPITVGSGFTGSVDFTLQPAASIAGTVTAAATGSPLYSSTYAYLYDLSGNFLTSDHTDVGGAFAFDGLAAGKYFVAAQAYGYHTELYDDVPCGSPCVPTTGTQIPVAAGTSVTGIDLALDINPSIEGTVVEDGTAMPVSTERMLLYSDTGSLLDWVYTSSDGSYRFRYLTPGTYYVRSASDHHLNELYDDLPCASSCTVTSGTPVAASYGVVTSGIDFALVPFGKIAGALHEDGTGVPLIYTRVAAYDAGGVKVEQTYTLIDGTYRIPGLPDGSYFVATDSSNHDNEVYDDIPCGFDCDPTAGTPVPVATATVASGIDFSLPTRGEVTGTITHTLSGLPVDSAQIRLYEPDGYLRAYGSSGSDGRYSIGNVPAGSYYVATRTSSSYTPYRDEVYPDLPCTGSCDPTGGTLVSVQSATSTTGIDFALDRLGIVEGSLTTTEPADPYDIYLRLYDASGNFAYSKRSDYGGTYRIAGVRPGTYHLATYTYPYTIGLEDELYDDIPCDPSCDLSLGTVLPIDLNSTVAGADFRLSACPASSYESVIGVLILSASYQAEACETLTAASSTVAAGASAVFRAGQRIVLGDGFKVEAGASFQAVIEPAWSAD